MPLGGWIDGGWVGGWLDGCMDAGRWMDGGWVDEWVRLAGWMDAYVDD